MKIKSRLLIFCMMLLFASSSAQWRADGEQALTVIADPANTYYGGFGMPNLAQQYSYPLNIVMLDPGNTWNSNTIMNQMYAQIEIANNRFNPINMRFLAYNNIHVHRNTGINTFDAANLQIQATNLQSYDPNAINLYIVNQIQFTPFAQPGGYATYPWLRGYRDVILLDRDVLGLANHTEVLSHELGHLFGLYHTFGGVSLWAADDYIPDTQWDPNVAETNLACPANSTFPAGNIMSYNAGCQARGFSADQLELMRRVADHQDANRGRRDDFSAGCEAINVDLASYNNIPGNNTAKHIIKIAGDLVANLGQLNSKFIVEANRITINTGTIWGNISLAGGGCNGQMINRMSSESIVEEESKIQESSVYLYPNPVRDYFSLSNHSKATIRSIRVSDSKSTELLRIDNEVIPGESLTADENFVSGLPSGLYILIVTFDDGTNISRRFVKM